ncbi:MAG TPA: peroxidase family protein, partial [Thermoanaerobaculia bacterium]|nr:peroxidase family protein [Thermoanaerobaculia bacterium]
PKTRDLPRNTPEGGDPARALIGDPRNDENAIVSQLQGIFLRFHNAVADHLGGTTPFADVQRLVRWHYQYAILHDFLPTIVGPDMVFEVLPHLKSGKSIHVDKPQLRFFHWRNAPFMPVEFSVAAYRFGHSMIRPFYRLNPTVQFPIFTADGTLDLRAFGQFPPNWAIDWRLFFPIRDSAPASGPERVQPAYKIDTSLVNPLGKLPDNVAKDIKSLAHRNLLRGLRMGLPSGQTVARHMGFAPIPDDKLRIGKATEEDAAGNPTLVSLSPQFKDNAPLWYYVLAEAQQAFKKDDTPIHLGRVGGRIVTEVFAGLLLGDKHSYLAQDPEWRPLKAFRRKEKFGIAELILAATGKLA